MESGGCRIWKELQGSRTDRKAVERIRRLRQGYEQFKNFCRQDFIRETVNKTVDPARS